PTGKIYQQTYPLTPHILLQLPNTFIYFKKKYPQLKIHTNFFPSQSINSSQQSFTFPSPAATSHLIINTHLTFSPSHILLQQHKTKKMIQTPHH
ncbi:hypothetical protein, partial [Bacillus thuringiensis]|uniref:hypothetical protein n=1 Tax=Bacillus thuringiensis TaxID=1428 RepID=UPI001C92D6AB